MPNVLPEGRNPATRSWRVAIGPPSSRYAAATPEQQTRIGNQTGGRAFLFMRTDDFEADYARLRERGVDFVEAPRHEEYGRVVVFRDLYGNKWDLVERLGRVA